MEDMAHTADLGIKHIEKMNLVERLINEVACRPMLWNRFHNEYNNRAAMDVEWDKISAMLKKDKEFVKQKWRNLRDQFQREIKKVKVPYNNPTRPYIEYYRGKWIYFENMLFLKDMQPRTRRCFSIAEQDTETEDIKQEIIDFDDELFAAQIKKYDAANSNDMDNSTAASTDTENTIIQPKIEMNDATSSESEQEQDMGLKRKASEESIDEATPAKFIKPTVADASSNTEDHEEIDDDLHFVKSLVPYLRKLNPIRKLLVRNEIQSLLIRESLCDNCKFSNNSCHST